MAVLSYILNIRLGLTFDLPLWNILPFPLLLLGFAVFYSVYRPGEERITELALYFGLWIVMPIFGAKLTFIGLAQGFPLADDVFELADRAVGFHWLAWWNYLQAHSLLRRVLDEAYKSIYWEPFLLILAAWKWAPGRNRELLTAILVALILTTAIATLVPAIGPAARYGLDPTLGKVIVNLRSPHPSPVWYMGAVCFPSFHTAMAVIYAWGSRKTPLFWPIMAVNLLILASVPASGDHYLIDVFGGLGVALIAITPTLRASSIIERPKEADVQG